MHLRLSKHDEEFLETVRDFVATEYPQDLLIQNRQGRKLTREDHVRSQVALQKRGWLAASWPRQHGGPGWSPLRRFLFERQIELAGVPDLTPMALTYIGPIIAVFGTDRQKQRWLPAILESREMWAQGYSEPGAGSDLASLSLKAEVDGADYILNGTKVWTTRAHWADWIFCLARTSTGSRKSDGLSMICVPMDTPGIRVTPIRTMDGYGELCQVQFDNVRTARNNRIGEEGRAWHYANVLLDQERLSYTHIGRKRAALNELRDVAVASTNCGGSDLLLRKIFKLEIELDNLELGALRILTGDASRASISVNKIISTELAQKIDEIAIQLFGVQALAVLPDSLRNKTDWGSDMTIPSGRMSEYLYNRAQTIYGGTTEIQKNIAWRELFASCN